MKSETTPGPWFAMTDNNGNWQLQNGKEYYHPYENLLHFSDFPETAEANAKLAASAPVLRDLVDKQGELIKKLLVDENEGRRIEWTKEIEQLKQQL